MEGDVRNSKTIGPDDRDQYITGEYKSTISGGAGIPRNGACSCLHALKSESRE